MVKNDKDLTGDYFNFSRDEMLKYIPNNAKKIIEIGCGEGNFCSKLLNKNREIWGLDINADAAKEAKRICYKVLIGSIDSLIEEIPDNYFDCIIFNDVLEHLQEPWSVLETLKSKLSDNGVVVSSMPNFLYINNLFFNILKNKDFKYNPKGGIMDITHLRFFTPKSIRRMYDDCGYEVVLHEGIKPCKSWKEKLTISLSFGLFRDSKYKQYATVSKVRK